MPDTNFLTRKLGPLPVWTYALGVAALVALFALYKRGQSTLGGSSSSIPASPYASSDQGVLNYPPTVIVTPAGVTNTPSTTPTTTTPAGTTSPTTPASSPVLDFPSWIKAALSGQRPDVLTGIQQGRWADVTGQYAKEVAQLEQQAIQAGRGGAESEGMGSGGTIFTHRSSASRRWDYFTPFQPVQYVDGSGYGGGGAIGHTSRVSGIPALRLQSLNYHLRRRGGRYGPGIVRIS